MGERSPTTSIAHTLLSAMAGLVLTVFGVTVAVGYWRTNELVDDLLAPILHSTEAEADGTLRQLFDPVTQRLVRDHGLITHGLVKRYDPNALVAEFLPSIEQLPQSGSMIIADTTGYQFLLMRYDEAARSSPLMSDLRATLPAPVEGQLQFFTRDFRPAVWGTRSVWTLWAPDGRVPLKSWEKELPGYDPKTRPWFTEALAAQAQRTPAELRATVGNGVAWSDVYALFTTKALGISASLAAKDPSGETVIVAYDVLLDDLSVFTQAQRPTPHGRLFVFTDDERVIGLPADERYAAASARSAALLQPVGLLTTPGLPEAMQAFRARASDAVPTRVDTPAGATWMTFRPFKLGARRLWIGIAVPESDLRRGTVRVESIVLLLSGLGLLAAIALARVWAARFARPLSELAERSEQIASLNLAPTPRVASRLREITQLSQSLETMRSSLAAHISEREAVADELRASERRFRLLVDSASDMIVRGDLDGRIIDVNPAACVATGYAREEMLELWIHELDVEWPAERLRPFLESLPLNEAATAFGRIRRKDDSTFAGEVRIVRVVDPDGHSSVVALVRDVTARAEIEEQQRQAQKLEALGRLAGGIAHDFNNLLTVVMGFASSIRLRHATEASTIADLDVIDQTSLRAADMTRQLLSFARRQVVMPTRVDLRLALREVGAMMTPLLGETIELEILHDDDVAPVQMDPGQLQQLLVNLCINARDAMPDGGRLVLEARRSPESALEEGAPSMSRLLVTDSGVGIPEELRARIFEPFFTTKREGLGTGLGLATCLSIVESAGGQIKLESAPGGGTTFVISLPLAPAAAPVPARPPRQLVGEAHDATILLVEDDRAVRGVIARTLQRKGYRLLIAESGAEALELVAGTTDTIDVLVTDVVMAKMGGAEVASRMKALRPDAAVVFVSGYVVDHPAVQSLVLEGATFLQKPFAADDLLRSVHEALARRKALTS